jgi:hypothetical protein
MVGWTCKCYDDGVQTNLWQRWFDENSDFQGHHDSVFDFLEQQLSWRMPQYRPMGDIGEVRVFATVQHRVFGFFGPQRQQFIVLITGYHKDKVYKPKEVIAVANRRMKEILKNPNKAIACARPR